MHGDLEETDWPFLGVVIVSYCSREFVGDCLESLFATGYPNLKVVVVDNHSPDGSAAFIQHWANDAEPALRSDWPFGDAHRAQRPIQFKAYGPQDNPPAELAKLTLIEAGANLGFAGGSNVGLSALLADDEVSIFWNLNPDTVVEPAAPYAFARCAMDMERFALIAGRLVFFSDPDRIQLDGGTLSKRSAITKSLNFGASRDAASPGPAALDFVSGASMVASREFIERAGLMDESYFLYYEEIDWQLRRGDLPFGFAADAVVRHHAGASIGSGGLNRPAPFSVYFTARNLLRFVRRWRPASLPLAYLFAWIRMMRRLDGSMVQLHAFIAGLHQLPPPAAVRERLPEEVWDSILGSKKGAPRLIENDPLVEPNQS